MFRKEVRELIWVYLFVSLGSLLLHLRIHPPKDSMFNWIATGFATVNTFLVPFLFNNPTTVTWAYLFTWATVVTGAVAMTYFSLITWKLPVTAQTVIMNSTLPDIIILLAKLPLAHKILRVYWPHGVKIERRGCAE
ncbi:MAG: hypothetical protein ACE5NJ_00895 [Thermodesulfobacteriota bacterium]